MGIMMIAGTERRRQGCSLQDGKQWGASGYAVTFPIAFNVVYNVLSIPQTTASTSNAYWGRFYITALTKNGFNVSDTGAGSNRWIAIGSAQPQWGYYVESQNPTDYRYWSIPFTSHYITMATKTYYEPKEEAVPWLVGIDMQKFICGYGANFIGSSYVSCVGIGCQPQWGFEETETKTIAFPISFESIKYVFLSKIYGPASGGADTVAYNFFRKSLTGVSFDYAYTRNWLAIGGKQPQWGKTISGNNVKTKFPIAFTAFCMLSVSVNSSNGNAAESVFRNGFGYTNKTLSDWILRGPTGDATYFADYIAIGCQPQWRNNPGLWAIPFTEFVAGGITMTRTGSQSSGTWYGDSGTISLTGYTASCATNESWVSNISGSAIAVGL